MAEITGTSYLTIIGIAFLPAILFYGAVVFAVHLVTLKQGAGGSGDGELGTFDAVQDDDDEATTIDDVSLGEGDGSVAIDSDRMANTSIITTFVDGLYLWVPLAALVYMLVIARFGALYAGFWAAMITIPTAFVQEMIQAEDLQDGFVNFVGNTIDACRLGIQNASTIALAAAVMGLFVGVLSLTGFSATLAQSLVDLAGGELALLLVLAMITSILFGLGMPTVAAYIVAVILVAPALVNLGLELETAHFFVFYFAILSAITPPVAITCIIATEIADGNFWTVCKKSLLLGGPLFVLPYVFVVNDSLLYWSFPESAATFLVVLLGMMSMVAALVNYVEGRLGRPMQVALFLASVGVMFAPVVPSAAIAVSVRWTLTFALAAFFAWRFGLLRQVWTGVGVRP